MKSVRFFTLLMAAILGLGACSKEDDKNDNDPGQPEEFYLNVTMNGEEYVLSQNWSTIDDEGGNINTYVVKKSDTLRGYGLRIYISDLKSQGVGTHLFDFVLVSGSPSGQWWVYSDTVNITQLDLENRIVKGNFDNLNVTSGWDQPIEMKNGDFRLKWNDSPF